MGVKVLHVENGRFRFACWSGYVYDVEEQEGKRGYGLFIYDSFVDSRVQHAVFI